MAWIKVDQSLRDHRKLLIAADILDICPAYLMGMIISLWLWSLDNVPTGNLDGISARMIARAAQWDGDAQSFVDALTEAGFLDEEADGSLEIHNWHTWTGKLLDKRQHEKDRSSRRRSEKSAKSKQPAVDQRSTAGRVEQTAVDQSSVDDTPSSPSSTRVDQRGRESDIEASFTMFWEAYPKKVGKKYAYKVWQDLSPDTHLCKKIMKAIDYQKQSAQWAKNNGQYIPTPANWLQKTYWDNEEAQVNEPNQEVTTPGGNWTDGFRTARG